MMTISIGTMIEQVGGLSYPDQLTAFENGFVQVIIKRYHEEKKDTRWMSETHIEIIDSIWRKHFAA